MSAEMLALIDAYLDKAITDAEFEELSTWLRASRKHVALFVERSYLHRQMDELLEQSELSEAMHGSGASPFESNILDTLLEVEKKSVDTVVDVTDLMHRRKMEEKAKKAERIASWQRMAGKTRLVSGSETRHYVIPRPLFYGSIAAVIAIAAAIIWPMIAPDTPVAKPDLEVAVQPTKIEPVAELLASPFAKWVGRAEPIADGSKLLPGTYELESGLAKVRFSRGAQVIIEGPAAIELLAADQAKLLSGRIVGYCPAGSEGFTVNTKNARVTDLGTEFGVSIDENGIAEAHVFDGEVELTAMSNGKPQGAPVNLEESQARSIDSSGTRMTPIAASALRFLRGEEFNVNMKAASGSAYHRWLAYSMKLRRDPSAMAYYTFEEGRTFEDPLVNVAQATKDGLHGVLGDENRAKNQSEPRWTHGRFRQKRALDFNRDENQVVIVAHDERLNPSSGKMTIAAWVKRYDPKHFGVLVSKFESPEEISYQLGGWGMIGLPGATYQLQFVVNKVTREEPVSNPSTLKNHGEWEHIAVTFDGATVKFYYNGLPAGEVEYALPMLECEADLVIGKEAQANPVPNAFNGELDELILLSRVMTDEEIEEMYRRGVPAVQ